MKHGKLDTIRNRLGLLLLILLGPGTVWAAAATTPAEPPPLPVSAPLFFLTVFVVTTFIGVFAALAGGGGGVIFTPLFMGFTLIDSYVLRATGLLMAMVGALVAGRPYLRRGLVNMRLVLFGTVPYTVFAVGGAVLAGYIESAMGQAGEALIRAALGVLVLGVGVLFTVFGRRARYPQPRAVDEFTARMGLQAWYYEPSLDRVVEVRPIRAGTALPLFCLIGLVSGLFGLGAGWAIVPVFNLVMLVPLKIAATTSTVMISLGCTAAVWPYLGGGGVIPLFAVPCMLGLTVGGLVGSRLMLRVHAGFIRWIMVVVMIMAGIRLILKAVSMLQS